MYVVPNINDIIHISKHMIINNDVVMGISLLLSLLQVYED